MDGEFKPGQQSLPQERRLELPPRAEATRQRALATLKSLEQQLRTGCTQKDFLSLVPKVGDFAREVEELSRVTEPTKITLKDLENALILNAGADQEEGIRRYFVDSVHEALREGPIYFYPRGERRTHYEATSMVSDKHMLDFTFQGLKLSWETLSDDCDDVTVSIEDENFNILALVQIPKRQKKGSFTLPESLVKTDFQPRKIYLRFVSYQKER